jgi:hypothetical protein
VTAFATESAPNGVPVAAGCDDNIPGTDEGVGSCANGLTEIQEDVDSFTAFMTFLAPPPRSDVDRDRRRATTKMQSGSSSSQRQLRRCHTTQNVHDSPSPRERRPGRILLPAVLGLPGPRYGVPRRSDRQRRRFGRGHASHAHRASLGHSLPNEASARR